MIAFVIFTIAASVAILADSVGIAFSLVTFADTRKRYHRPGGTGTKRGKGREATD